MSAAASGIVARRGETAHSRLDGAERAAEPDPKGTLDYLLRRH